MLTLYKRRMRKIVTTERNFMKITKRKVDKSAARRLAIQSCDLPAAFFSVYFFNYGNEMGRARACRYDVCARHHRAT